MISALRHNFFFTAQGKLKSFEVEAKTIPLPIEKLKLSPLRKAIFNHKGTKNIKFH